MITFRIKDHSFRPGVEVVEVYDGDQLIAGITPGDSRDLRITSKFLHRIRHVAQGMASVEFSGTVTIPSLDLRGSNE